MLEKEFVELVLTCGTREEAEKITQVLLEKRLIACAKFVAIDCKYWWEGKITDAKEVMLFMESIATNFEKVEAELEKIHSYDTFILKALPMTHVSKKAQDWLINELGQSTL
ncbi:MAG TPA: divalent-cation tolerance protein CutA [Candidatus Saccharimonadales bacterium]|nr:divalent-cation tolerance protein CutA [Candidatus Saccharimonadales bacterium]